MPVGMRVSYSFACGTRIGSYISATRISSPACRQNCAGQCSAGTTASAFARRLCCDVREPIRSPLQQAPGQIQLAPANLQWCSDKALRQLSDTSRKYNVPLHMHLLETAYQKEYARRRGGGTAVEYIGRFDLLGPQNWVASPTGRSLVASRA